jgi:hypothetical protein
MRLLFTSLSFMVTLVVGAIAFAATAIEFPGIMRDLIEQANRLPPYLSSLGISDSYMVWLEILLTGDKLVLLGFVLVTRIVFALIGEIFSPPAERRSAEAPPPSGMQVSAFHRWGKKS